MNSPSAFSYRRRAPLVVLVALANQPLVQASGGRNVTEAFFDNDQNAGVRAASHSNAPSSPAYDFIHGEPYGAWA